jgi:DNA-binding HxlR family transcriptional regulator
MRGIALADLHCSVARTLDVVGERWTLLVLRDAFQGKRRFEDFSRSLPIARNVLTSRLKTLVEHGILERRQYEERPPRYEYRLTDKGRDLYPVIVAMVQWGDRYLTDEAGPPLDIFHRECGGHVGVDVRCRGCGETITAREAEGVYRTHPSHPGTG